MGILSNKDIQAFAKLVNTSMETKKQSYSVAGTIMAVNADEYALVDDINEKAVKSVQVLLDGGVDTELCTAYCTNIVCAVNDRVVVTIEDGVATVTENYTNPNGNDVIIKEVFVGDTSNIPAYSPVGTDTVYKYVYLTKTINIPEDYVLIGIKSVGIQIRRVSGGHEWTDWRDVSVEGSYGSNTSGRSWASHAHLAGWNIDGSTITITLNMSNHSANINGPFDNYYAVRARLLVVCMKQTILSEQEEENNG